jgi:hypothetical protein
MKVFVIEDASDYYGPYFRGVASTLELAKKRADELGPATAGAIAAGDTHSIEWRKIRDDHWMRGNWHVTETEMVTE